MIDLGVGSPSLSKAKRFAVGSIMFVMTLTSGMHALRVRNSHSRHTAESCGRTVHAAVHDWMSASHLLFATLKGLLTLVCYLPLTPRQ